MKSILRNGIAYTLLSAMAGFAGSIDARGMLNCSNSDVDARGAVGIGAGLFRMCGTQSGGDRCNKSMAARIDLSYAGSKSLFVGLHVMGFRSTNNENAFFNVPPLPALPGSFLHYVTPTADMATVITNIDSAASASTLEGVNATQVTKALVSVGGVAQGVEAFVRGGYTFPVCGCNPNGDAKAFVSLFAVVGMSVDTMDQGASDSLPKLFPSFRVNMFSPEVGVGASVVSSESEGFGMSGSVELLFDIGTRIDEYRFGGNFVATPGIVTDPVNDGVLMILMTADKQVSASVASPQELAAGTSVESVSSRPIFKFEVSPLHYTSASGMFGGLRFISHVRLLKASKFSSAEVPATTGKRTGLDQHNMPVEVKTWVLFTGGFQV